MLKLDKYELMALDAMGTVVIERSCSMTQLRIGGVVRLCVDIGDKSSDPEFDAVATDVRNVGGAWLYTLRAVRSQ